MKRLVVLVGLVTPCIVAACTIMNDRHLTEDVKNGKCDTTKKFTKLTRLTELNTPDDEEEPRITPDELTIYFTRVNYETGENKMFVARRQKRTDKFGRPEPVLPSVGFTSVAAPTEDGGRIYFIVTDEGDAEAGRLVFADVSGKTFGTPTSAFDGGEGESFYSPNVAGSKLYFSHLFAGENSEIFVGSPNVSGRLADRGKPVINAPDTMELDPILSADGKTLYFYRQNDGESVARIFVAHRNSESEQFGTPTVVDEIPQPLSGWVGPGGLSPDNCRLYYYDTNEFGTPADIAVASREP